MSDNQNPVPKQKSGMRRWVKALFALSLALNLAVIGLAVGAAWRVKDFDRHGHKDMSVGALIFRDLDKDTRRELRRRAEGDHTSFKARRSAEERALVALLEADPFDVAPVAEVLEQQARHRYEFQQSVQEAWLKKLQAMSHDQRMDYAAWIRRKMERHRWSDHDRKDRR